MEKIFKGLFDADGTQVISVGNFLLCVAVSLIIGVILCVAYTYKNRHTKSFAVTLTLIPAVVCVVIMMVNGNIGTGVAVAGAFGLVRFRSAQGSAKEITAIFIAMGSGLIAGMGYLGYAVLFTLITCIVMIICNVVKIKSSHLSDACKTVKITIPESLDYTGVFDGIFEEYTTESELIKVKTTNMGSLFRLTYDITLKNPSCEKQMIDRIRERNGNLEITVSKKENRTGEL